MALFEETAQTLRRHVGTDTHIYRATLNRLGEYFARHGQLSRASGLVAETHRLAVDADGPASSDAPWSLQLLAQVRAGQGDLDEAGDSLRRHGQPALDQAFAEARTTLLAACQADGGGPEFEAFRRDALDAGGPR